MADVVIIGAGPAGIFAGLELMRLAPRLEVVIVEQGRDISERTRKGKDMLVGWGGAGAYSDRKLTISTDVGGQLHSLMPEDELMALLDYVDGIYAGYPETGRVFAVDSDAAAALSARARLASLLYVPARVRHIGTENCYSILRDMHDQLQGKLRILCNSRVEALIESQGRIQGVKLADGSILEARSVIVAPGRVGAAWMAEQARDLGLQTWTNPVDLGVRVELPAVVMEEFTRQAYETKLVYYSKTFDDKVRTFCMNPYGEVVRETVGELLTVNGHSWANRRTENTNFALLVSSSFTEPFDDPIGYGKSVASMANMLGKGVILQRLGDLLGGRRTTASRLDRCTTRPTLREATPGDLSYCFPYRILTNIIEMLACLDRLCPGVNSDHTLLYGVEVKFYSNRIQLDETLMTCIEGLYVIGDGAGITRGLMQASCSGVIAARSIAGTAA